MSKKNLAKNFEKSGYLIIKNFLSKKEMDHIFSQLENLIDVSLEALNLNVKKIKSLDEKYLLLLKKNKTLKSHYYDYTRLLDSIVQIGSSKKFIKISKLLLKSKTVLIDSPQIRVDHFKDQRYLSEHQELNQLSKNVINFWIPLVNVNKKSGGIFFRPKTHELGHLKYKNSNMSATKAGYKRKKIVEKLFSKPELKRYKSIYPKLKKGDAVIFHPFIFHGTTPNKNKKIRWTIISRFNCINSSPYLKDANSKIRIPYTADYNLLDG